MGGGKILRAGKHDWLDAMVLDFLPVISVDVPCEQAEKPRTQNNLNLTLEHQLYTPEAIDSSD